MSYRTGTITLNLSGIAQAHIGADNRIYEVWYDLPASARDLVSGWEKSIAAAARTLAENAGYDVINDPDALSAILDCDEPDEDEREDQRVELMDHVEGGAWDEGMSADAEAQHKAVEALAAAVADYIEAVGA